MIKRVRQRDQNTNLARRTTAERIWLWRHRQHSNLGPARGRRTGSMSQIEAASRLGLSTQQYIKLENGESTLLSAQDLLRLRDWPDTLEAEFRRQPPSLGELCFLARRRSGRPVAQVARDLHTTTTTYGKWEMEGDARVRAYWEGFGYKFPPGMASPEPRVAVRPTPRVPAPPVLRPTIVLRRPGDLPMPPPRPVVMLTRPTA